MRFKKSSMILYNNALSLVKVLRIRAHSLRIEISAPRKNWSDFLEKYGYGSDLREDKTPDPTIQKQSRSGSPTLLVLFYKWFVHVIQRLVLMHTNALKISRYRFHFTSPQHLFLI